MSEEKSKSKSNSISSSDKDVKAPNVFERVKEEFEAVLHGERHSRHHHKETHGLRKDIDENTPVSDVKAPNVFERAKEEIEALVQAIHPKKKYHSHSSTSNGVNRTNGTTAELKTQNPDSLSDKDVKAPNVFERVKEEFEAVLHGERHSHHHHKETHGLRKDIDENMPVSDVKAPNVFERAKEEIEALVQAIHPKKEDHSHSSTSDGVNRTNGTAAELKHSPDTLSENTATVPTHQNERIEESTRTHLPGQKSPHCHHKETHGRSDDIDDKTPVSEVKGPNIFERANEEIEALFHSIHPKK